MLGGLRDVAGPVRRPIPEGLRHLEFVIQQMGSPGNLEGRAGTWLGEVIRIVRDAWSVQARRPGKRQFLPPILEPATFGVSLPQQIRIEHILSTRHLGQHWRHGNKRHEQSSLPSETHNKQ